MIRNASSGLLLALALAIAPPEPLGAAGPTGEAEPRPAEPPRPPVVELREILVLRGAGAEVSPRVQALAGRLVRVRGWLVVFEEPPAGAFWLAPLRVFQDESGAGSGDLPPGSIRVSAPDEVLGALPPDAVPVEAAGRLEVGRQIDGEGRVSVVRLLVEEPRDVALLRRPSP